jgi:hypothetical protein
MTVVDYAPQILTHGGSHLLHATNFATHHWPQALGQRFYAFALGVLYAYWLEKSRSVVAASIGHNVGDVVEYLIAFAWLGISHP